MQKSLAVKSTELQEKNDAANLKLKQMVKDQQEAEKQKSKSQEIRKLLEVQRREIAAKRSEVMEDLAKVEPAVQEASQVGVWYKIYCKCKLHIPCDPSEWLELIQQEAFTIQSGHPKALFKLATET